MNILFARMRKFLAIFLISIHLLGNTEVGQLVKLPSLVSHFFQHHQLDQSIDFIEFLVMHYAGDDGTTADDSFDNTLPCHQGNPSTVVLVFSPMVKEVQITVPAIADRTEYGGRLFGSNSSKHVLLVLQPPREV